MKRFIALFLTLAMLLSLFPINVWAEDAHADDQVYAAEEEMDNIFEEESAPAEEVEDSSFEKAENSENDATVVVSETITVSAPLAYASSTAEARWGITDAYVGLHPKVPSDWAGIGSLEDAFSYVSNTAGTAYIQLLSNVDTTAPLEFARGKTTILDLNGKTIDRGLTKTTANGYVIKVNGTLVLCDTSANATVAPGKITGGYNNNGSGVYVGDYGRFDMYGGTISGNTASYVGSSGSCGGGVLIGYEAYFNMFGGTISGNSATNGGGVACNPGYFKMNGGTISGNTAYLDGGGVYLDSSVRTFKMADGTISENAAYDGGGGVYVKSGYFSVSNTPNISGNKVKGVTDNVYLANGKTITVGNLSSGANIGVTMADGSGTFTSGGSSYANSGYFVSDSTDYAVVADGSDLQLVKSLSISFHANGGSGTMSNQSVVPGITAILNTNTFVRTDYVFDGWNTSADGTGTAYSNGQSIVTEEDTVLYAQWEAVQVQWGVTNGTDMPSSWDRSSLTTAVACTNNLSSGIGYIQLLSDVTITESLKFSKTAILDLNGHDIDRGLAEATESGNVITVDGNLTLCDTSANAATAPGKITGGYNSGNGGGVVVNNGGIFTMTGGVVSGNAAANGGGVYNDGTLVLTGGSISGNTAETGGGLYNADRLSMTGGVITGNNATVKGGGVYRPTSYNSIYISDSPVIYGNVRNGTFDNETGLYVLGETGRADNLLITSQPVYVDGVLNERACIGVNKDILEGENDKKTFTVATDFYPYRLTKNDFAKFSSDSKYAVVFDSSNTSINLVYGAFLDGFAKIGVGQEETLTLSVAGNNIIGVESTLEYDSSKMSLVRCESIAPGWRVERVGSKITLYGEGAPIQSEVDVLEVTLHVKAGNQVGVSLDVAFKDITLQTESCDFSASDVSWSGTAIAPPQARWGKSANEWVDIGSLSAALDYANTLKSGTAYIQLLEDVEISNRLTFLSDYRTTLDLNGHDIDRGLTVATEYGYVISVSGYLTICDTSTTDVSKQGKITGGYNRGNGGGVYVANTGVLRLTGGSITGNVSTDSGGGVYVNSAIDYDIGDIVGGSFTMSGGSIAENHSTSSGGGVCIWNYAYFLMTGGSISRNTAGGSGGGVDVALKTTFTMTDGTISGNSSDGFGGGVSFSESFTITGGSIIGNNTATDGGGVYFNLATMYVSGNPIITGNVKNGTFNNETGLFEPEESGTINNVRVFSDYFINVTGPLGDTAYICGTTKIPNSGLPVTFAKGSEYSLTEIDAEKFIGDPGFCATFNGTSKTVQLVKSTPQTVRFDMQGHGTKIDNQTVMSGSLAVEPTAPVDSGYRFCGWYKEPACTNKWNFSTDIIKRDTVLYARWRIDQFCGEDITWEFDSSSGTLTFEGTGVMDDYASASDVPYAEIAEDIKKVVVEEGVTGIDNEAFTNCTALTEVVLPSTLKAIDSDAFDDCSALVSISVADGNRFFCSVDDALYAKKNDGLHLMKCPVDSVGELEIAANTESIEPGAITNCQKLTSVSIPAATLEKDTSFLAENFYGCGNLTEFSVVGSSASYFVVDGVLYKQGSGENTSLLRCPCGYEGELTVPATCTDVNNKAFYDCSKLSAITFEGATPAITDTAFIGVKADAFYMTGNRDTWSEEALQNYGGKLTWSLKCDGVNHISSTGVAWDSNADHHWQQCFCGLGLASGAHEYGDDNRCDECGYASGSFGQAQKGDVNLDGEVNADDLTALARHVAKIETLTDSQALLNADVDDNGTLSADDLTKLARYVAKIIPSL